MSEYYYKIMNYKNGNLKTLFHGLNGSKTISMFKWLQAKMKKVSDGTNGTKYISGWHIFESYDECKYYLKNFQKTKNKIIVRCKAKNIWSKKHSRNNVLLAEWIYINNISRKES